MHLVTNKDRMEDLTSWVEMMQWIISKIPIANTKATWATNPQAKITKALLSFTAKV